VLLVDRLFHRELSNPLHKTNVHCDYSIPFPPSLPGGSHPASFFTYPQSSKVQLFTPLNPHSNRKPINTAQFLQKKLRWLTIGDQYDWNTRAYPSSSPTHFPADIAALVTTLFQNAFKPQSGVVLLYSAKDYMPVHRDVSEECHRGLASFSLGCDGLFILARDKYPDADECNVDREQETVVIRVRSGDVVLMGGQTRWAWHAMPKILSGTCPEWLQDWPVRGIEGEPRMYEKWRGYMRGKRLNISCRQVWS
jgi:DNA alkylation damage repair protein AlkB